MKSYPTIVITGATGHQINKYWKRVLDHYEMLSLVCDWNGARLRKRITKDGIALFTSDPGKIETARRIGYQVKTFAEVVKEINDAIPLTDWIEGKPTRVGEYIASIYTTAEHGNRDVRRYWNGEFWSIAWSPRDNGRLKASHFQLKAIDDWQDKIRYRGLSQEPIILE